MASALLNNPTYALQPSAEQVALQTNYITNLDAWRIEQILQSGSKSGSSDNDYFEPLDTFSSTAPDAVDDLPF